MLNVVEYRRAIKEIEENPLSDGMAPIRQKIEGHFANPEYVIYRGRLKRLNPKRLPK